MTMTTTNHPVQLAAIGAMISVDIVGLALINRYKKSHPPPAFKWETRRNAYWFLIAALVFLGVTLDAHYPIDPVYVSPIKSYVFAFPLGLLDLYFSKCKGVSTKVVLEASLWCSSVILRQLCVNMYFGKEVSTMVIVTEFTYSTLFVELARFACALLGVGLLSDLIFSPMHRLAHHPKIYKNLHKTHHEYTNHLTALVLYHGDLLDDFLMPFTTTCGGFLYILLLSYIGWEGQAFSNAIGYLIVLNTLLAHAHDIRCARLLAPLPASVNFVAYHFVHHVSPDNNFGLTVPSDMLWDYILGTNTILKFDDAVQKQTRVEGNTSSEPTKMKGH